MKRFLFVIGMYMCCIAACSPGRKQADADRTELPPTQQPLTPVTIEMAGPLPTGTHDAMPTPTAQPLPSTFSLRFVGDLMCCNHQIAGALQPDGSYDFNPPFDTIRKHLQGADVLFGNLETNVYDGRPINGEKRFFNAPPAYLDAIKNCGFDVLFTANNHALDVGVAGQLATIGQVRARGMDQVGSNLTPGEAKQIYMREVRGVQLAVLSYTGFTNKNDPEDFLLDGEDASWAMNLYTAGRMEADVSAARENGADVVVMYLHEGWEKTTKPNKRQLAAANAAFAAGVDILVMSHTHSLLPMETRRVVVDGVEKTVFCAYGLGNFMSSALPEEALNNVILNLTLTCDPVQGKLTGLDAAYLLTYTYNYYDETGVRQFVVVGMEDAFADPSCVPARVTTNPERVRRAYEKMLARIGTDCATPVGAFLNAG